MSGLEPDPRSQPRRSVSFGEHPPEGRVNGVGIDPITMFVEVKFTNNQRV